MRTLVSALAGLLLVVSVLLTVARFSTLDVKVLVQAASFATYALVGFVVALVLLLLLVRGAEHRWVVVLGVVLALVGAVLHALWLAPLYRGHAEGAATDLTVMTSNLHLGQADPVAVVRAAAHAEADVVVLEELTPTELGNLDRAGLGDLYPHRAGGTEAGRRVTMVFSRYALTDVQPIPVSNGGVAVTVATPRPFRLLAVHTESPGRDVRRWSEDLSTVRALAARATRAGSTVVAGDLNSTTDHAQFRRLLGAGLSDAPAQAGSGWQPTWPTRYDGRLYRPLVAIDHVLTTPDFSAVSTRTVELEGTDHLALVARLDRR